MLHEAKIHRAEIFPYHILKTIHPLSNLFHGEMCMDDGKMIKQFQQIRVHTFQEIKLHHLQPFFIFLEIRASIAQKFL